MSEIRFERPTEQHIRFIAANMRDEDAVEVHALGGYTPLDALEISIRNSERAVTVLGDGVPLTMLGLVKPILLSDIGVPWLLSARQALDYKRQFLELSPPVIDDMLQTCPKLINFVHSENKLSIRWLKWLGFTIEPAIPMGPFGAMFHPFHKER